jgi:hypothetical protein
VTAATIDIIHSITEFYNHLLCVLLILLQIPVNLANGISGFLDFIYRPVFENREIPCVIHHRHNPSETTWQMFNKKQSVFFSILTAPI